MTNEERAALVEHLRHDADDLHDFQTAADQIEADGKRIAELEEENFNLAAGACLVNGGIIGDEHGHFSCTLTKRIAELEEDKQRLKNLIRTAIEDGAVKASAIPEKSHDN